MSGRRRRGALVALAALAALAATACTGNGDDGEQDGAQQDERGEPTVSAGTYAGPIPDDLDVRLQRRDTAPLPADGLVKFQLINRGPNPRINYRWLLLEDGRIFIAQHSGDTSDPLTPFDTELPDQPTGRLETRQVEAVREQLRQSDFFAQPPYQADETVEDGTYYVVTARLDGNEHEVIYEAIYPPVVEFLDTVGSPFLDGS